MSSAASHMSVVAAFLDAGGLKAVMPLLMASTPVRAVVPELNARSITNANAIPESVSTGTSSGGTFSTIPSVPETALTSPVPIISSIIVTKK